MTLDTLLEEVRSRRRLPPVPERQRIRKAAGVSQRALGQAIGVSWTTIDRWEDGSTPRNRRHADDYAHALAELERLAH